MLIWCNGKPLPYSREVAYTYFSCKNGTPKPANVYDKKMKFKLNTANNDKLHIYFN